MKAKERYFEQQIPRPTTWNVVKHHFVNQVHVWDIPKEQYALATHAKWQWNGGDEMAYFDSGFSFCWVTFA